MTKRTSDKAKCANCESTDLGRFLCRTCFENRFLLDSDESILYYMNELNSLFPELEAVDNASTFQEVEAMADELDAKLSARLTPYQQERFFFANDRVKSARLALVKIQDPNLFSSNFLGIALLAVTLLTSALAAFYSPGFLVFLIPIGGIAYFNNFAFCRNCRKFVFKRHTLVRKTVLNESYGSHTEHQEVQTSVQNYDSRGRVSGYSSASTYIPHNVEHVDETAEYAYACNYCGHVWGVTRTKRFNLN